MLRESKRVRGGIREGAVLKEPAGASLATWWFEHIP